MIILIHNAPGVLFDVILAIMIIFNPVLVPGKSTAFGFGILFRAPIYIPILAFDSEKYVGRLPIKDAPE